MPRHGDQNVGGYSVADTDALLEVCSSFIAPPPGNGVAMERDEIIERLRKARALFERLRDQHDHSHKGYEQLLFMFYDDLLHKAQQFDPIQYLETGIPPSMPRKYELQEFHDLGLMWFSDIIRLWDRLSIMPLTAQEAELRRRLLTERLREIYAVTADRPRGEHLTCERAALLALIGLWLRKVNPTKDTLPVTARLLTTVLPTKCKCILRVEITNTSTTDVLELIPQLKSQSRDVEIISEALKIRCGPTSSVPLTYWVRCEAQRKQDFQLCVSSAGHLNTFNLPVNFCTQALGSHSNPYKHYSSYDSFPFPSRSKLAQDTVDKIQEFVSDPDPGWLVVELYGRRLSGKTTTAKGIRGKLASQLALVIGWVPSSPGEQVTPDGCKEVWGHLLEDSQGKSLLLLVDGADTLEDRKALAEELFDQAQSRGLTKAVFFYTLSTSRTTDRQDHVLTYVISALEREDIVHLLNKVGLVGGEIGDPEILDGFRKGSLFLHFDEEIVEAILKPLAEYPEIVILSCDKLVKLCNEKKLSYVTAETVHPCIQQACEEKLSVFEEDFIAIVEKNGTPDQRERRKLVVGCLRHCARSSEEAISLAKLAQKLRGSSKNFNLLSVIQYLVDNGLIIEHDQGYRFRNTRFWELAKRYLVHEEPVS